MDNLLALTKELNVLADKKQAAILQRFFKTGKGEYGYGDVFLGIKVPVLRGVAKKYQLSDQDIKRLLLSKYHEFRLIALLKLVLNYQKGDVKSKENIYRVYLNNISRINNWDLVDLSAPAIVGDYLEKRPRKMLYQLAKTDDLWSKRIAIISTFTFIRLNDFSDTLKLSERYLIEEHDLLHKACGWMLREVGKRNRKILTDFLDLWAEKMPRVMLRYAIEKLPEGARLKYLRIERKK